MLHTGASGLASVGRDSSRPRCTPAGSISLPSTDISSMFYILPFAALLPFHIQQLLLVPQSLPSFPQTHHSLFSSLPFFLCAAVLLHRDRRGPEQVPCFKLSVRCSVRCPFLKSATVLERVCCDACVRPSACFAMSGPGRWDSSICFAVCDPETVFYQSGDLNEAPPRPQPVRQHQGRFPFSIPRNPKSGTDAGVSCHALAVRYSVLTYAYLATRSLRKVRS